MAIGEIYQLEFQYQLNQRKVTVHLHYNQDNVAAESLVTEDLNIAFNVDVIPFMQGVLSQDADLQCLYSRHATSGPLPRSANLGTYHPGWEPSIPDEFQFGDLALGSILFPSLPANSCLVLKLIQNTVTASHNGRIYLAGVPESEIEDGQLTDSYVDTPLKNLQTALASQILAPASGTLFSPVVLQTSEIIANPSPPPATIPSPVNPPNANPVVDVRSNKRILTQRRRTTRKTAFAA